MRGFIAGMSVHKSVSSAWQGPVRRIAREVGSGTNVDERLKAARERREEQQRLLASRVHNRYEREQRAKLHYEQQLQERQKKLQEQKRKEDRRRAAVEEKRLQYLKEEKERNESAVRRTKEKSQRAQQKSSQNVSGRKPTKNAPRHIALSTWEKNLVSRLLTPTSSFLARSKSAADQSGEEVVYICRRAVSFYSTTSSSLSSTPQLVQDHRPNIQKPQNQRPQDKKLVTQRPQNQKLQIQKTQNQRPKEQKPQTQRPQVQRLENQKPQAQRPQMKKTQNLRPQSQRPPPHLSPSVTHSKSTSSVKPKAVTPHNAIKKTSNAGPDKRSPVKNNVSTKTSRTTSSPSPERVHRRSSRRHSIPLQLDLESVPEEDVPICNSALSPGNSRPGRPVIEDRMEDSPETQSSGIEVESRTAGDGSPSIMLSPPSESMLRPSSGTTDPEEASRLLAERRREARQLRELEEQKRLEAAEAERRSHEALERHRAEERARQQAEAEHLIAEKQRREEEESKKAEEERLQAMREAALLHKQREEEQAREREKAAQIQKERELYAQKEEAERQVRKKRLEEIMRRTRGTVSPDMKSATVSILPNENTEPPVQDAVKPPSSRPSQIVVDDKGANDDMVPVVAFKERRSLRTLTGLEDIQTHQRAEVI
ncbi:ensconsin-like isoform X1 [Corythoichthys intestinalis]|uniref:ensconsin-like isoform X1 n=1 Tax=Corythoichthys intestinalis TaxID=161448 RepID=UPI0025A685D1|nr:ensconsin-like isoform X1 [Corythoichthys intestinalis]